MTQSPPTGELVARLERYAARAVSLEPLGLGHPIAREAADRITTLERELEEARKLNNKYAWERDKAREERDAAERRSEAYWRGRATQ